LFGLTEVVDVEATGLTVVCVELGGVTVGVALEQAAARIASPITMAFRAFMDSSSLTDVEPDG